MIPKSIFLLFCALSLAIADISPVFLWGANSEQKPAIGIITENEFSNIIEPILTDSMVVVFLEKHLDSSDLSTCKVQEGEASCYSHLRGVTPKTYYTSVESPVKSLEALSKTKSHVTVDSAGNLNNDVTYETGKILFVRFEDDVEDDKTTAEIVQLHDMAMDNVFKTLSKSGKIVGVYTSIQSPTLNRSVRQEPIPDPTTTPSPVVSSAKGSKVFEEKGVFLLYYTTLGTRENDKYTEIEITNMTISSKTANGFNVSLQGTQNVKFSVKYTLGYFQVKSIDVDDKSFIAMPILEAPRDFSYFCGNKTIPTLDNKVMLEWNSLQFQAPLASSSNDTSSNMKFGDAWHCVGFVSIGILAGLFVTVIMLIIVAIGICWIMDINTMDRFDDPKGKTITINATE